MGASGSVGAQALEIARAFPDELKVCCLTAHEDIDGLAAAAHEFKPEAVAVTGRADAQKLRGMLPE
ncbi:MAG TPA: 1-deoxy-D-xylulose-5-phosphate reductoisomerase, partial [Clostridiales bacterium]|nr:1-deoxy-D-xylulose-5-phosphate reductoisomerase [Clostridiales bacterium]